MTFKRKLTKQQKQEKVFAELAASIKSDDDIAAIVQNVPESERAAVWEKLMEHLVSRRKRGEE